VRVNVSTAGNFSLATVSSVDTYGYIYNDACYHFDSSRNILSADDNGGGNGQFKLTIFLRPQTT
jgi:hypothetical protein